MNQVDIRMGLYWLAVGSFTLTALVCDWKMRKIPNWLTVPSLVLALVFHLFFDGWAGLKFTAAGFALGFGLLLVLWLVGSGGAGDVKLMGALGAWLGFRLTLYVIVISTMIVALGSIVFLFIELCLRGWSLTRRRYLGKFNAARAKAQGVDQESAHLKWRDRRRIMPYAIPVSLATWLMLTVDSWIAMTK
jgi:prepilin peptidase CpaA